MTSKTSPSSARTSAETTTTRTTADTETRTSRCTGTLAFNLWLAHFKPAMLLDPAISADYSGFARRLMTLKRNPGIWRTFEEQWRMARILFEDDFGLVFNVVKEALRIEPVIVPQAQPQAQPQSDAPPHSEPEGEQKNEDL